MYRPSISGNDPIIKKIHFFNYVLIRLDAIPVWFLLAALVNIIFFYTDIIIVVNNLQLNLIFINLIFLGMLYTSYFILGLILSVFGIDESSSISDD